jgi:hypothetical protein
VAKNKQLQDGSHYIVLHVHLSKNNLEVFTGSPLYLCEGEFFSDNQWVSSDGAFEGDG